MINNYKTKGWIGETLAKLSDFADPVPGSIRGHLNAEELSRVAMTSLMSGGSAFSVLNLIAYQAGRVFPPPADAGLAVAVLGVILECRRRLGHGEEPPRPFLRARVH